MPESVKDRPTSAHEHVFLLSKRRTYFYDADAIAEVSKYPGDHRASRIDKRKVADPMCMDNGSRARTGNPTGNQEFAQRLNHLATRLYGRAFCHHAGNRRRALHPGRVEAGTTILAAACGGTPSIRARVPADQPNAPRVASRSFMCSSLCTTAGAVIMHDVEQSHGRGSPE